MKLQGVAYNYCPFFNLYKTYRLIQLKNERNIFHHCGFNLKMKEIYFTIVGSLHKFIQPLIFVSLYSLSVPLHWIEKWDKLWTTSKIVQYTNFSQKSSPVNSFIMYIPYPMRSSKTSLVLGIFWFSNCTGLQQLSKKLQF